MQILSRLLLAIPSLSEQDAILSVVAAETRQLQKVTDAANRNVNLLREYRTRLIADVVTGKLDVREAAARLPDEADESESFDEADALEEADDEAAGADPDETAEEAVA